MKELNIRHGEIKSSIFILNNAFDNIGRQIESLNRTVFKAAIACDSNTKRYALLTASSLRKRGFKVVLIELPSGEKSKSLKCAQMLYCSMIDFGIDRWSCLISVGGGSLGDVAGFAASTYMRGIPFYQVPTTLLSQVDASIGGKTAVNLPQGKNLVGTFYQPKAVFIDPNILNSLENKDYLNGLAEIVKYAMIKDAEMFSYLESKADDIWKKKLTVLENIIYRCVSIKTQVVQKDERESGLRMILNYGHTVGHAIEKVCKYKISHGQAIAIGMNCESVISRELGMLKESVIKRQAELLERFDLQVHISKELNLKEIYKSMFLDKKSAGGKIRFVLPSDIGAVKYPVTAESEVIWRSLLQCQKK